MSHVDGIEQLTKEQKSAPPEAFVRGTTKLKERTNMTFSPTGAARANVGKPQLSKVPVELLVAVATVLFKSSIPGGGEYETNNWKKGTWYSTPLDSLLRHAFALANGEMVDPKSGMPHTWHIACNAMFLVYYEKHFPQYNDLQPVNHLSAPTEVPPMPNPAQAQEPSSEATPVPAKGTALPLSALLPMLGALMTASQEAKNEKD